MTLNFKLRYTLLTAMFISSHTQGIKVICEQAVWAKSLLFLFCFLGNQRVNGETYSRGESLKYILHPAMNSTLGPCIPKRKLWFGREWRQPVAWPWFTGGLRLPRVTNHNIRAPTNSEESSLPKTGRKRGKKERESYAKWHTSSSKAWVVSTAIGYLTLHEGN